MDKKNDEIDYIKYLTLEKMNNKIMTSKKTALELENEIYSKNNKHLSEREKIYFEFKRIYKELSKKYNVKKLQKENIVLYNMLLNLINNLVDAKKNNYSNYMELKENIIDLQIYLNMKSGFYSVVPSMLDEIDGKGVYVK